MIDTRRCCSTRRRLTGHLPRPARYFPSSTMTSTQRLALPHRTETPSSIPQTASPGPSCSSEVRFTCALPATLSGGIASPRRYPRSRSSRALCRCFTLSDLAPSWLARLSLLFGRGVSHPTCSLPLILSLEQHGDDEGE